ncbi:hypothetical protein [Mycobacterium conspicuum]|uniref:Uncharacterized protein n=1 Tax=Mycobacterium conspicuum TaxID=44010 RepID=A0A1X1TMZ5_9MYCO|nr:hypothetical protein [Mycobacterium conspicuum]ORV45930.1 hypothetical protein AWC00_05755 [Mycobacterium conspicuum]BBZ38803.1 hypothetical protein MCNS_18660 [Mycobacterium conspicuum]
MGNKAVSREARRAAREAATAAQDEIIRRTKANVEDLATFFDAREREDGVNVWLAERQQALREQAAHRRAARRLQCGTALRAMRDRGETLREIGRMAGISEKAVRELIRETESTEEAAAAPAVATTVAIPAAVSETLGRNEVSVQSTQPEARHPEAMSARG